MRSAVGAPVVLVASTARTGGGGGLLLLLLLQSLFTVHALIRQQFVQSLGP